MPGRLSQLLSAGWLLLWLSGACYGKRHWDYEPISVVFNSSKPDILRSEPRIERIDRGEYGLSGRLWYYGDMDETCLIEAASYRSGTGGEDDYKRLPWSIPIQTFKEYVSSYYKDIIYKSAMDCSNVPPPEEAYPWPKGEIIFEKCVCNGEGLPERLPQGYYKIIFNITGCVDASIEAIIKLTTDNDLLG